MVKIAIVVGSESDISYIAAAEEVLKENQTPYEIKVFSAHRKPDETAEFSRKAAGRGIKVIIAAAGLSAALPGFIASHTTLPVIGIPVVTGPLNGVDALLSILQMPSGVPLATVGLGKQGPKNAALLALRILNLLEKEE